MDPNSTTKQEAIHNCYQMGMVEISFLQKTVTEYINYAPGEAPNQQDIDGHKMHSMYFGGFVFHFLTFYVIGFLFLNFFPISFLNYFVACTINCVSRR